MGFWDFLRRSEPPVAMLEPNVSYFGTMHEALAEAMSIGPAGIARLTPAQMFECQPHLRTVVTFLARNIAQLGIHVFVRDGDDRKRDRDSALAQILAYPNPDQTGHELIFATVGDRALYDRAYWLVVPDASMPSGWLVRRLPPNWVTMVPRDVFGAKSYLIRNSQGEAVEVDASQILAFTGYHPTSPRRGSPAVEALKETLNEQIEASRYRGQVWRRGGRVSAVLQRPKEAPQWSPEARESFREDWYAKYTGRGEKAGGTPILEDGMTLNRVDFNAQEQQFVEAAKLAFATVASAYHVNPTMVGILDNANYSNVREFRRMLYGDTLGPELDAIEGRINTFLLRMLGMDPATYFAEFNIAEKLQGSFEEQNQAMQTAVGRPWMTADEARKVLNLPALGGDAAQLVTPLNVLVGGQASPTDSAPKAVPTRPAKAARQLAKAGPTDAQQQKVADVLAAFFGRQSKAVLSRIGSGGDWWDGNRWDTELASDLTKAAHTLVSLLGGLEAERLGYAGDFDPDQTVHFVQAVAQRYAENINATTKAQLDEQVDSESPDPGHVFEVAKTARAVGAGALIATFAAGFAAKEAGVQVVERHGVAVTKTWHTGGNPRSAHARMDGEQVLVGEQFSNGMQHPGDSSDVKQTAGCNCHITTEFTGE